MFSTVEVNVKVKLQQRDEAQFGIGVQHCVVPRKCIFSAQFDFLRDQIFFPANSICRRSSAFQSFLIFAFRISHFFFKSMLLNWQWFGLSCRFRWNTIITLSLM
ncbi:hypothetical protein MKW98_011935 [Papaver atlanticum]|uniref:Uncharacterized protein n=1 Tax=Papaver atlanticum TaxID=357466 RepID=A0AAD4T385_9MAGN|nr:hypothetical protein MKW98_011935 [Papaver atlanticum]